MGKKLLSVKQGGIPRSKNGTENHPLVGDLRFHCDDNKRDTATCERLPQAKYQGDGRPQELEQNKRKKMLSVNRKR